MLTNLVIRCIKLKKERGKEIIESKEKINISFQIVVNLLQTFFWFL